MNEIKIISSMEGTVMVFWWHLFASFIIRIWRFDHVIKIEQVFRDGNDTFGLDWERMPKMDALSYA